MLNLSSVRELRFVTLDKKATKPQTFRLKAQLNGKFPAGKSQINLRNLQKPYDEYKKLKDKDYAVVIRFEQISNEAQLQQLQTEKKQTNILYVYCRWKNDVNKKELLAIKPVRQKVEVGPSLRFILMWGESLITFLSYLAERREL